MPERVQFEARECALRVLGFLSQRPGGFRDCLRVLLLQARWLDMAASGCCREPAQQQQSQTKEQTVYVTKTGKKYHLATCRFLSKSKIPMSLKDAKAKGFTACSICKPPQ
jgi:hypothetical protein